MHIQVPGDVPVGPAEIVLTITPERDKRPEPRGTAADLAHSPLFGICADREDIENSLAYARQLRAQAERRNRG